jgi:SSS family solute:Na+ symporter
MAGRGVTMGLTGAWWLLAGSAGLIVLGIFFAGKVREYGTYTLPAMLRVQYDRRIGLAASILIVVAWVAIVAAQIIAAGKIMSVLGIGSPTLWMVIFAVVFITYTTLGGQYAVIRTDFWQAAIIVGGLLAALVVMLVKMGGWSGLVDAVPAAQWSFPLSEQFGAGDLAVLLLVVGLPYVVGPDMYSRLLSARDSRVARRAAFWTALIIVPVALAIIMIGMGGAALFPQLSSAEQVLPSVIGGLMPAWLAGIVLAALLCAMMSSADTILLSASSILSVDIIGALKPSLSSEKLVTISRWMVVVLGVAALGLALKLTGVISALLFAYTIYTGGVIVPVIAGFYRNKLKITPAGALAAIIGGGATAIFSKLASLLDFSRIPVLGSLAVVPYLELWALAVSVLLLFLVSWIDNGRRRRLDVSSPV